MRLFVMSHGTIGCDSSWDGFRNWATAEERQRPSEWYEAPSFSYAIDHPEAGWILFDTGPHRDNAGGRIAEAAEFFPWTVTDSQHYLPRLESIGIRPEDAALLVLSDLHCDRAGNLDLFTGTNAGRRVIVQRSELQHALLVTHLTDVRYVDHYYRPDFAGVPGISFLPIDGDAELAKGVRLLHLPGHTPGSQAVMLDLQNTGTVILTADAVYQSRSYGPPAIPPGLVDSRRDWHASVNRLRILERRHRARMFFGHDRDQRYGDLVLAPACYD